MHQDYDDLIPVKQIKMSNGEELICKLEKTTQLQLDAPWIEVTDALVMYIFDDAYSEELVTRYAFKPWMSLQDNAKASVQIRTQNIISYYTPSADIIAKYYDILEAGPIEDSSDEPKKPELKVIHLKRPNDEP